MEIIAAPNSDLVFGLHITITIEENMATKRGFVTHDQVNSLADEVNSEQIEDVLAMFSEMGVNVIEAEETADGEEQEPDEAEGHELVEMRQKMPAKTEAKPPAERIDDPVRLYMREIGSVELLSREARLRSPSASRLAARP